MLCILLPHGPYFAEVDTFKSTHPAEPIEMSKLFTEFDSFLHTTNLLSGPAHQPRAAPRKHSGRGVFRFSVFFRTPRDQNTSTSSRPWCPAHYTALLN